MNTNTIKSKKAISGVNDLATKCPMVSSMWSDKNTCSPREVSVYSSKKVVFVCPDCQKQFVTNICAMTSATASGKVGCLDCSGRRTTSNGFSKPIDAVLVMQDGSKATCTAYHGANNITVEFEDGFVLYHARWNQFVRGTLHHGQKTVEK